MDIPIMSLEINNEMDLMLAHRRGMQFAKFSGISLSEQTRFATAVSEISRNTVEHALNGVVNFSILKGTEKCILQAVIRDEGKGISELEEIMQRDTMHYRGRGLGIVFAKKLADNFRIVTGSRGTTVYVQKAIPGNGAILSNLVVQGWVKHLQNEPAISAYEELKLRNIQLVELTEEMKSTAAIMEKQLEEIQKLNSRLASNNERMKAFTYAISHDLKTPLTNLRISSKHFIDNPTGEETQIFQGILGRAVGRLDKTIHSLIEILDVQDQEKHVLRELDLHQLFRELLEEFEAEVKRTEAEVACDFGSAGKLHYVEGFLQSVLRNLLSNSLKYRDASRPLRITVTTLRTLDGVRLVYTDTGAGMDLTTIKDRLFAPFTRFSSAAEGKGIGLFLIKSMVENNGGTVNVESEPGKGTRFTFHLVPYEVKE